MSVAPEKREGLPGRVLRVLADHPDGLLVGKVAELAGEDMSAESRCASSSRCTTALTNLEKSGHTQRTGPRGHTVWTITQAGIKRVADGDFKAAPGSFTHGTNYGYAKGGCRCDACRAWFHDWFQRYYPGSNRQKNAAELSRKWFAENPEKARARNSRGKAVYTAKNTKSRDAAARFNQPWTGTDLEIASREDLTTAEAAALLGRTLKSVERMRWSLKNANPRDRMLRDGAPPPTSRSGPR